MLGRMLAYGGRVWVVGQIGVKIWMAVNGLQDYYGIRNTGL